MTKCFDFHRIFKNGGRGGGSIKPPLDPPLLLSALYDCRFCSRSVGVDFCVEFTHSDVVLDVPGF